MRIERMPRGLTVEVDSEADTRRVGEAVAGIVAPGDVLGLVGPLGAGKTRLVRAIAEALGVDPKAIASPTFVLIHEYDGRLLVYHFDTYRLGSPEQFTALGVEDYFEGHGLCLVEWADRVADQLPGTAWWIEIEPVGSEARRLTFALPAPKAEGLYKALGGIDGGSSGS